MTACIDTPPSWMVLERYRLGELGAGEADAVRRHLAACSCCSAVVTYIDAELRP